MKLQPQTTDKDRLIISHAEGTEIRQALHELFHLKGFNSTPHETVLHELYVTLIEAGR